jgi:TRAP-type mannitol/chloroaromatic compound transport system substrate-binding protein
LKGGKEMKRGIILFVCLTMTLVLSLTGAFAQTAEKKFNWRMTTPGTRGTILHEQHKFIAEHVQKASGGRLNIELFAAGELFPVFDAMQNVAKGVVEMCATYAGYQGGLDPAFISGSSLPGPMPNYDELSTKMDLVLPVLRDLYGKFGVHVIELFAQPPECFHSNRSITKVQDFKGLKVRSSALQGMLLEKIGCTVVKLASPEIYTALKLGTIDAVEYAGFSTNWEMGFQEVTKYIIEPTPHVQAGWGEIIVNPTAWKSLPPDLQATLELVVRAGSSWMFTKQLEADIKIRQKFIDKGIKVLTLPPGEWAKIEKASYALWDEWAAKHPNNKWVQQEVETSKSVARLFGHMR